MYNKMFMPTYYKSYLDDYLSLTNDVTLWDVGGERQVEISGKDAEKFVEYITPRDISKCKIGQCKYILLTDKDGGVVNDPVLLKLENNRYWLSIADSDVLLWCKGIASSNSFDVNIIEPDVSPLALQGPKALKVMEKLVGNWIRELKFFYFKEIEINKIPVVIARSGWSGEAGYEIYLKDGKLGNQLWEIFMNAGKEYKIAPAAPNQICRIECGMLSYGSDMTLAENPYDLNFDRFVNLDKKYDFLAKKALIEIQKNGARKEIVGIEISGDPFLDYVGDHLPMYFDGSSIGKITSSVYSPRLKKNIGLALIERRKNDILEGYLIKINNKLLDVKICKIPFIRNK